MVDQDNILPIGSEGYKSKSTGKSQNFVFNVTITNTMCFSTVLILLFLLSLIGYEFGLIDKTLYLLGISSVTGLDVLTYIVASLILLFIIGCIIAKNQKRYIEDHFGIRKIDLRKYHQSEEKINEK